MSRAAHYTEAQESIGTAAHALDDALGALMAAKASPALIRRLRAAEAAVLQAALGVCEAREAIS